MIQSRFARRPLPARSFINTEYESMAIVDDREEDTVADHPTDDNIIAITRGIVIHGSVPTVRIEDETTAQRCVVCGRSPGHVVAPNEDRFATGINHALSRLEELLVARGGTTEEEAKHIVKTLRDADVELP